MKQPRRTRVISVARSVSVIARPSFPSQSMKTPHCNCFTQSGRARRMSHKTKTISPGPWQTHMSMPKPQRADASEGNPPLPADARSPQGHRDILACDTQGRVGMAPHGKRKLENALPADGCQSACVQWTPRHLGPLKRSTSLLIPCSLSWADTSLRVSRGRNPGLCTIGLPSVRNNMDI